MSAAGELALIQRIEESIQQMPNKNQPLSNLRDSLSDMVKQAITIILQKDFRTHPPLHQLKFRTFFILPLGG